MSTSKTNITMTVFNRIDALAQKREDWQQNAYARSNQQLYSIIADCLALYQELTQGEGVKARKEALADYIKSKNYRFKESTGLDAKIIRCVFEDKDRRRLQTYTTVLRVAISQKWTVDTLPARIAELGGVQEVSLHKSAGMSKSEKAKKAKEVFLDDAIAVINSPELDAHVGAEKTGDSLVAVMTREENGSFTVHFVLTNTAVVDAALVAKFSASKDKVDRNDAERIRAKQSDSIQMSKAEAIKALTSRPKVETSSANDADAIAA